MTKDQVAEWALTHGFTWAEDNVLVTPYKDTEIHIILRTREIKVTITKDGQEHRLGGGHPSHMFIDDDGVLQGAGLSNSFLARFCRAIEDVPPWYPDAVVDKVRAAFFPDELPPSPSP